LPEVDSLALQLFGTPVFPDHDVTDVEDDDGSGWRRITDVWICDDNTAQPVAVPLTPTQEAAYIEYMADFSPGWSPLLPFDDSFPMDTDPLLEETIRF
jgi:hypothetical protein